MGLDMYLYATQNLTVEHWKTEENNKKVKEIINIMGGNFLMEGKPYMQSVETKLEVAYWRKANAIHRYFVDYCADGKDECQAIYVDRDNLQELLNLCKTVLEDHSKAEELLPSQSGFLFGSTEYGVRYFDNLQQTVTILEKILKDSPKDWGFEYQASW